METLHPQKMKHNIKFLPFCASLPPSLQSISVLLAVIVFSFSSTSYAAVTSVTSAPSSIIIPVKGTASVGVTWEVTRFHGFNAGAAATVQVSSQSAQLQIGNRTIATLAGQISVPSFVNIGQSGTVTLRENITVSTALARRIARNSAGSVRLVRTFTDNQNFITITRSIPVFSGSANSGPLAIRRIDITFENDARTDVIHKAEKIRAIADISFRSSGFLRGEWRLVDPTASLGQSGGRIIKIIQQNLVSSGEGRVRITSPLLPSIESGLYFVTFSVTQTSIQFNPPILRYFVLAESKTTQLAEPLTVQTFSPKQGETLDQKTEFSWAKIKGAMAYQIELFKKGENRPITGKLVPSGELKLSLSALSFELLQPRHNYHWRVRAFNREGKVVALSELQPLSTP